jgi:hypothetical protein
LSVRLRSLEKVTVGRLVVSLFCAQNPAHLVNARLERVSRMMEVEKMVGAERDQKGLKYAFAGVKGASAESCT